MWSAEGGGSVHSKNRCVSSRQHRATEVRKLRFLSSCQYTHGCYALASWAARHTTVCLDVWHVAICGTSSTTCSGSLINDNFVITSASCMCDQVTFPQSVVVKMNKKFGCQTQELDSVDHSVIQIICHPMYNDTTLAYNVSLFKLGRIVDTSIFKPVCLPTDRDKSITSINRFSGVHGYENFDYVGSSIGHSDIITPDITEEL